LYRNRIADFAWFCVEAETLRSTARWLRKRSTCSASSSRGWRLPEKRMYRLIQST
jgi:hypothetical protein